LCLIVGALVESRFARAPQAASPPSHGLGAADEAVNTAVPEIDLEGTPFPIGIESLACLLGESQTTFWRSALPGRSEGDSAEATVAKAQQPQEMQRKNKTR
jgi:hypothetical protein